VLAFCIGLAYMCTGRVFDYQGKPANDRFLCARGSDDISNLNGVPSSQPHQWGSMLVDMGGSGDLSILLGLQVCDSCAPVRKDLLAVTDLQLASLPLVIDSSTALTI
jgi:hypothetical protein